MTSLSYEQQVKDISANPTSLTKDGSMSGVMARASYTLGHLDATKSAAEIAARADARIAELAACLQGVIDNNGGEGKQYHASKLLDWTDRAKILLAD